MLYYLQNIVNKNTCHIDWMSFDFHFKDFFSNLHLNKGIDCVTDQPSITSSSSDLEDQS